MGKGNELQVIKEVLPLALRRGASNEEKDAQAAHNRQAAAIEANEATLYTADMVESRMSETAQAVLLGATKAAQFANEQAEAHLSPEYQEKFSLVSDRLLVQTCQHVLSLHEIAGSANQHIVAVLAPYEEDPPGEPGAIQKTREWFFGSDGRNKR